MTKTVLITGAGRGLGRTATLALLDAGHAVIGTTNSHPEDSAEVRSAAGDNASRLSFLPLDVTLVSGFDAFVSEVSTILESRNETHLYALINNAGIGTFASYPDTSEDQFDELFAINTKAPFFLTQKLLPLLQPGSRVLNVTTALTRGVVQGMSAYAMTKGAVEVLTRYQAVELAPRGISVNTLMGGAVNTGFGGGIMKLPAVQDASAEAIAWGRMAQPSDIAAAIPALLAESLTWATGGIFDLSGGQAV